MPDVQLVVLMETAQVGRYELSLYDANAFSVTWELVPGCGAFEKASRNCWMPQGRPLTVAAYTR